MSAEPESTQQRVVNGRKFKFRVNYPFNSNHILVPLWGETEEVQNENEHIYIYIFCLPTQSETSKVLQQYLFQLFRTKMASGLSFQEQKEVCS